MKSKAVFLCLILLLATEVFVTMNVHKLRSPSLSALVYKQYLIETGRETSYDMIIMGDSRFMGLNARYISQELSRELGREFTVYNFALLNQGIRTYTLLLRKYLRNHEPPEYILFGSAPLAITGEWAAEKEKGRNQALHYLGQLYSIPELFEALPPRSWGIVLAIKCERLSNLVLYRKAIQKAIDRPNYFYKDYLTPASRYLNKNNGGLIIGGFTKITEQDVRDSQYFKTPLTLDPEMDFWYRQFFAEAKAHNIQILLTNAPMTTVLYDQRELNGSHALYRQVVARWQEDYDNLQIIPPLLQPYPIADFKDWHHLNLEGSYAYIDQLAVSLVKSLRQER